MTLGNKHWAIGRAVERALAEGDAFTVYQHRDGSNDWCVRAYVAAEPRNFVRRFNVFASQLADSAVVTRYVP